MTQSAWEPISEAGLASLIKAEKASMQPTVAQFWRRISIQPEKWQLSPWGDVGGGFWVVAVMGQQCIWYNDIEDGFNISRFEQFGRISEYLCNQDDLDLCVRLYLEPLIQESN